ncbi:hypothetical protein Tco_0315735, partial [Tanacetum coccineum]
NYGVVGDDYEGAPVVDDDYEEALVFNDDQFEEESMPVYDTDIEDVIEEEEGFVGKGEFGEEEENMEDVVVVANDLCSSMIQTTLSVDFSKTIDSNPHELIWSQKFVDQFANRMNDMMDLRRCKDRNGRRSEDEELGNPFFEGDCSSSNEWGDYGVAGDDYEGAPIFDDDYEEASVFYDDQFEEESMPVYDTDIEDVIEEEEGFVRKGGFGEEEENMEDIVVVANDLCSSMIQTTLSVDFLKTIDSNPHELIWPQKGDTNLDATSTRDE